MDSGYRSRVATEVKTTIEAVRAEIRSELADYLSGQRKYLTSIASELVPVCDALDEFLLDGGKRLRPLFAYAGLIASGATPSREIVRALSSLELLQACALIHDDLMDMGETCCPNRVARLTRLAGIKAQIGYKRRPGSYGGKPSLAVDNTLDRQFDVPAPDRAWVTDITYIRTLEGFAYLAVVIDLYSRRVVGWSMQNRQTTAVVRIMALSL